MLNISSLSCAFFAALFPQPPPRGNDKISFSSTDLALFLRPLRRVVVVARELLPIISLVRIVAVRLRTLKSETPLIVVLMDVGLGSWRGDSAISCAAQVDTSVASFSRLPPVLCWNDRTGCFV